MRPYWRARFANPSAVHQEGVCAARALHDARGRIAAALEVKPSALVFTSGGTEANNLALYGTVQRTATTGLAEVVTTRTEHPSVLATLTALAEAGYVEVKYVEVGEDGRVDPKAVAAALTPATALVTLALANSETGVVQPIRRIANAVHEFNRMHYTEVRIHTDASQAPLWEPVQPEAYAVDLMTLDAGKCNGPKGVGVLVHRRTPLTPTLHGGTQESGLRPGTENVPGIVGAAVAFEDAIMGRRARAARVRGVRDYGLSLLETIPGVVCNGHRSERLANNINISLPGLDTEYAVVALDAAGIAAATKSACAGKGGGRSEVVYAMTEDEARSRATLRFSLTPHTTARDMRRLAYALSAHVWRMARANK